MSTPHSELDPNGRWLVQCIVLAELADLPSGPQEREAREFIREAAGGGIDDATFGFLVDRERARLGAAVGDGLGWPTPLALAVKGIIEENFWDRRLYRLRDAFEVLVKYLAAIALADVMERAVLPPALRIALIQSLKEPSLGHWILYLQNSVKALDGGGRPFIPELVDYHRDVLSKYYTEFSSLRNVYAHGGTPEQSACRHSFESALPSFVRLMTAATFLKRYTLVGIDGVHGFRGVGCEPAPLDDQALHGTESTRDGAALLRSPDRHDALPLSPLLVYRLCHGERGDFGSCNRRGFLFYNHHKSKGVINLLDYPFGHQSRDAELLAEFDRRIPLDEWKDVEPAPFADLVDEVTRNFVGRHRDLARVRQWLDDSEGGFCVLTGPPGVGKTAVVAALSRIGAGDLDAAFCDPILADMLRAKAWPGVRTMTYFIRRGETTTGAAEFLRSMLERLSLLFPFDFAGAGTVAEMRTALARQLPLAGATLTKHSKRLLILIDGLDECVATRDEAVAGPSLLACIPRSVPAGVFVVLSGRPHPEVELLRSELRVGKVSSVNLDGLTAGDVRSLLYRTVNKYEVTPEYVACVARLSEGNPLYIHLLTDALREGRFHVNDLGALPESLESFYRSITDRLVRDGGDAQLGVLMIFALAREQLSADEIAGITGRSLVEARKIIGACLEVLTETRDLSGRAVYRVFHESFGDHLRAHPDYAAETSAAARRILVFAAGPAVTESVAAADERLIDRVLRGSELRLGEAAAVSRLVERASRLLTAYNLLLQALLRTPGEPRCAFFAALALQGGAATARMAGQCLMASMSTAASDAAAALTDLIERRGGSTPQAEVQAVQIALAVAEAVSSRAALSETVRRVLKTACFAANSNVRALGILALFRVTRVNQALGIAILQELADRSVRFGFIRRTRLEAFIACALGLFLERPTDEQLVADLKRITRSVLRRILGLRLALWVVPKMVTALWGSVPDDYQSMNIREMQGFKDYVNAHPEVSESVERMIRFVDPAYGTFEELAHEISRLDQDSGPPQANLQLWPAQPALIARALNGDEAALELTYQSWKAMQPPENGARQDFIFRLRVIQVGMQLAGQSLAAHWTARVEEAMREFFYERHATYHGVGTYYIGGLIPGLVFLAHREGAGEVPLLKEFIDWAADAEGSRDKMRRWDAAPRDKQPDALLMRTLEGVGVEFGLSDPLSRGAVFFGLRCFLVHAGRFDEFLWDRMGTVLARLRIYVPDEVERFIAGIAPGHRDALQGRMNRQMPRENIGVLLSFRVEMFYAMVMSEPPAAQGGLREQWQQFLRTLLGPQSMSKTLQELARRVIAALLSESKPTSALQLRETAAG